MLDASQSITDAIQVFNVDKKGNAPNLSNIHSLNRRIREKINYMFDCNCTSVSS